MAKALQVRKQAQDEFAESRGLVELLAAEAGASAENTGPAKFRMTLYTGEVLTRYNYLRDREEQVVMDVAGFKPKRSSNLPAMVDHYARAGTIDKVEAVPARSEIIATGRFLANDANLFPASTRVQAVLASGHPMQSSGRWVPLKVEEIQAGSKTQVNGKTLSGPLTVWREFSMREGSFVDLGRDEMTDAELAASQGRMFHQPQRQENAMPSPIDLIASLKSIFGADRAIELVASKSDADGVSAFLPEILAHIEAQAKDLGTLKASVAAKDAEITELKASLEKAKAAPAVVAISGDPSNPAARADGAAKTADDFKAEYESRDDLKAEYGSADVYVHAMLRKQEQPSAS